MAKRKKAKPEWLQKTLELSPDHQWQVSPGYQLFVAGRGAVRFEVPQKWHFEPDTKSFKFLDKAPPDDDCRLEVSYNQLPPAEWKDFPLKPLLKNIVNRETRNVLERGEIISLKRQTAQMVWTEIKFLDSNENREAYSRICIALGSNVQCLITFDYWVDDAPELTPVWDNVLQSLVLGLYVADPRIGTALPD